LAGSGGNGPGVRGVVFDGVALAPPGGGFGVGGSKNVDVRASGEGAHATVTVAASLLMVGAPGADAPVSSGNDTGVDGVLFLPLLLVETTK